MKLSKLADSLKVAEACDAINICMPREYWMCIHLDDNDEYMQDIKNLPFIDDEGASNYSQYEGQSFTVIISEWTETSEAELLAVLNKHKKIQESE